MSRLVLYRDRSLEFLVSTCDRMGKVDMANQICMGFQMHKSLCDRLDLPRKEPGNAMWGDGETGRRDPEDHPFVVNLSSLSANSHAQPSIRI